MKLNDTSNGNGCEHKSKTISAMMSMPKLGIKDSVLCGYCGEKLGTAEWKSVGNGTFKLVFDPPELDNET